MRTDKELLQAALAAIECSERPNSALIEEIADRLAEPGDEPYAYVNAHDPEDIAPASWYEPDQGDIPPYRHPRQPVRLSDEEILAIAENYAAPDRQDNAKIGLDGEPTGEFYPLTLWAFCSEELTAFARELLDKNQ